MWLRFGNEKRPPPELLPILLHALLNRVHCLRALELLARFLDLGCWTVNMALTVGFFPNLLILLQCPDQEMYPWLVSIWAKILAVDPSCKEDLIRNSSHK